MKTYPLPVNLADLLDRQNVESDRVEFKEGWNPAAILRTVCTFANDFHNYGGGYVLVGVKQSDGLPVLPPAGVPDNQLDRIQRELLRYCNLIQPPYFPLLDIEETEGQKVLVLWCPGGQNRPYKVPKDVTSPAKEYAYYIRRYANTVIAKNGELRELISLTATVPFDDRTNHHAVLDDLKLPLIRSFLKEVKSGLYSRSARMPFADLGRQLAIIDGPNEAPRPGNVGLLFFSEAPERFFPGTQIDVVYFPGGPGGDRLEEQVFVGPVHHQLRDALRHLKNRVVRERVTKLPDQAESVHIFNYPYPAIEEALVNAIYHRGYDQREPIEVRVNPGSIEVLSYPGPDSSVRPNALEGKRILSRRYRNRRIGELLKELELTEGRFTGIPKIRQAMRRNGSPPPNFVTDEERTFFAVELLMHPAFQQAGVEAGVEAGVTLNETEYQILRSLGAEPEERERDRGSTRTEESQRHPLESPRPPGRPWLDRSDHPRQAKQQESKATAYGERADNARFACTVQVTYPDRVHLLAQARNRLRISSRLRQLSLHCSRCPSETGGTRC